MSFIDVQLYSFTEHSTIILVFLTGVPSENVVYPDIVYTSALTIFENASNKIDTKSNLFTYQTTVFHLLNHVCDFI